MPMLHTLLKALLGSKRRKLFFVMIFSFAVLLSSAIQAEQLPIKTYTTADGLVSNRISRIKRDTRGFLWFCTEDGLSRFDGYSFTNYTTREGLPDNWVDDFLETRDGIFLVATSMGLCVFNPQGSRLSQDQIASRPDAQPMFTVFRPDDNEKTARIKVMYEDRQGNLFCGTVQGLYQLYLNNGRVSFHKLDIGMPEDEIENHRIRAMTEDQRGNLWVASDCGLYRRSPDGTSARFSTANGLPQFTPMGILTDHSGRMWVSMRAIGKGIYEIATEAGPQSAIVRYNYAEKEGLPCPYMNAIFESFDKRIWVSADCGLAEFFPSEKRFRPILTAAQLVDARVWS